jgi:O-antigen/teichoic acid export membrane protein
VPAAAMQPTISAVWDVITAAVMTVAVIAGMLWFKERGYFVGVLVGAVVVSVGYYAYLARRFGLTVTGQLASARGLLKANPAFVELSLISYAVAFISPLALLIVRGAVLERFGEASAGLLQAAIGISLAINLILNPLNGLLLTPRVNRALAESEKHRETASFQRRLLLPIAIVAVPPILFPDVAVIALYSGEFVDAAPALYWFVMGQAMMQIQGIYTALMIGLDRLKAYGIVVVLGTAMYAALAVLLVPHLGLTGAGIASFASACLLALGTFGYLRIRDRFAIGREAGFGTLLLFAGLGLAGAAIGAQSSLILPNLIVKTLICLLAIGIMVPISLDRDERHALATRLGAVFRRG